MKYSLNCIFVQQPSIMQKAYVLPQKRKEAEQKAKANTTVQPDLADSKLFPKLGGEFNPHPTVKVNFKKAVDDFLEKEKLDILERNREPEIDPTKMTNSALLKSGWAILDVSRNGALEAAGTLGETGKIQPEELTAFQSLLDSYE